MPEYLPRVVTYGRALQTWILEENFRKVVDLLGGSAFSNGWDYSIPRGALTDANLFLMGKLGNEYKAAPYSLTAIPLLCGDLVGAGTAVVLKVGGIARLQTKTTVLRAGITFTFPWGADASGNVVVNWTSTVSETLTFANLPALTLASTAARATLGATDSITVTLNAGAVDIHFPNVTLYLLVKHVS